MKLTAAISLFFCLACQARAFQLPTSSETHKAIAVFQFDEGAGAVTRNAVAGPGPCNLTGAVWVNGYMGGGLNLGVTNGDRMECGNITSADFTGNSTFTLIAVMKMYSQVSGVIMAKSSSGGKPWRFQCFQVQAGDITLGQDNAGTQTKWGTGGNFFLNNGFLGKWVDYILVFTGTGIGDVRAKNFRFYANGDPYPWTLIEGSEPKDFVAEGNNFTVGNFSSGGSASKNDADFDSIGVYGMDLTRGSDRGAKALHHSIMGHASASVGP